VKGQRVVQALQLIVWAQAIELVRVAIVLRFALRLAR
jgi:hypothetical protein